MPSENEPREDRPVNTYAAEIRHQLRVLGLSLGDVEARGGVPKATLSAAKRDRAMKDVPKRETVDGIAKGLGIPSRYLRLKIAQSLGLIEDVPVEATFAFDEVRGLTRKQLDALRQAADAMREPGDHLVTSLNEVRETRRVEE